MMGRVSITLFFIAKRKHCSQNKKKGTFIGLLTFIGSAYKI